MEPTSSIRYLLVVEDDEAIRCSLHQVLESEGYQVAVASHGKEGLERLISMVPRPQVILLDLMMPVMNGWQFSEVLSKHQSLKYIPVILLTAYGDQVQGLACHEVINKPFNLDRLLTSVEQYSRT